MTEEDIRQHEATSKKKGFGDFMGQPSIRLLISTIPTGERAETLETLLQEAFDHGFRTGAGSTALQFVKAIFDPHRPRI